MAPAARLEVLVEYRPRFAFKGRANFLSPESRQSVTADLSSFAGMVAAYIDLPVKRLSILTPDRRAKLTPLSGTAEVVPVVNREDPRGFV